MTMTQCTKWAPERYGSPKLAQRKSSGLHWGLTSNPVNDDGMNWNAGFGKGCPTSAYGNDNWESTYFWPYSVCPWPKAHYTQLDELPQPVSAIFFDDDPNPRTLSTHTSDTFYLNHVPIVFHSRSKPSSAIFLNQLLHLRLCSSCSREYYWIPSRAENSTLFPSGYCTTAPVPLAFLNSAIG